MYGATAEEIVRAAAQKIGRTEAEVAGLRIVRRSIDTRLAPRIRWSLAVEFEGDPALIAGLPPNEAGIVTPAVETPVTPGSEALRGRPVVVGAGPAGLFAALALAQRGYRPLLVERGKAVAGRDADVKALVEEGRLNSESNFLFGEGGAGAYSDGKLTTRTGDSRLKAILETLVSCGAGESILIDARPHIGSDVLPGVVTRLGAKITGLGGEFRFGFRVARLVLAPDGSVTGVESADGGRLEAGVVILAVGNSARDIIGSIAEQGVAVEAKPFQVGVRIEHRQRFIDERVYRKEREALPAAEYIMSCPSAGAARGMATFCMCPGGMIVPAISEEGHLSTNGMSRSARSGQFGNAALVVTINPDELPGGSLPGQLLPGGFPPGQFLPGFEFQRELERAAFAVAGDYRAPAQRAEDFLKGRASRTLPECSYPQGVTTADLRGILPEALVRALERALPYFDRKMSGFVQNGLLVGVESRVSSPVRIVRDRETLESVSTPRLYPAGEGSGYAGGIMTSAADGMRAAEAVIARYAPIQNSG